MRYVDFRNVDDPEEVCILPLDPFTPTPNSIGRRDSSHQLTVMYVLYHYVLYYANDFKPGLADKFKGLTLRKLSDLLGFSVVAAHQGMKNVVWRAAHEQADGKTKEVVVVVGSIIMRFINKEKHERGLTGQGDEVRGRQGNGDRGKGGWGALVGVDVVSHPLNAFPLSLSQTITTAQRRRGGRGGGGGEEKGGGGGDGGGRRFLRTAKRRGGGGCEDHPP